MPPGFSKILVLAAAFCAAAAPGALPAQTKAVQTGGESVRLKVNFQSCRPVRTPGSYSCVFYGGGMKYFAVQTADTDIAAFRPLHETAPGAPMVIEGRVRQSFGGTAEFEITRAAPRIPGAQDRMLQRLQGDWVSETDAADEFSINGSERKGYYAGLSILTESIAVQDSCGGAAGRPPYLSAFDQEGGVGLCYEIISASEDELLLNYLPRGVRLRFLRKR
jgi:hypothetical protein